MKKNVCLYAMMALAVMGCSQNNKKQEGSSKGLSSRFVSDSKDTKLSETTGNAASGNGKQSASDGKVHSLTASDFRKKIIRLKKNSLRFIRLQLRQWQENV